MNFVLFVLPFLIWDIIQNPDEWKSDWDSWFRWKEKEKVQGTVVTGTFTTLFCPGLVADFREFYEEKTGLAMYKMGTVENNINPNFTGGQQKPPSNSDPASPEN